ELPGQGPPVDIGEAGRVADMVELSLVVEQPEQQGAREVAVLAVAKTADDAVGGADVLDLEHGPLAALVGPVEALGDHAVERAAGVAQPVARRGAVTGLGRQAQDLAACVREKAL